ncbi:MAG: CNNM domain-containing protein, partial [Nocardioidaceae bacterium]
MSVSLIVAAALLVLLAGLLASAEAALSTLSKARAEELAAESRGGATRLLRMASDPPRYINTTLLLRVAAETASVVLVALVVADEFGATWQRLLIAVGLMVVVSYVAIGVGPRTLGQQHSERVALAVSGPVMLMTRVLGPVSR